MSRQRLSELWELIQLIFILLLFCIPSFLEIAVLAGLWTP